MFERYTEKARRAIFFARYEASQYGSPYIESEHLLLGLLREGPNLTEMLGEGDVKTQIRSEVERHITPRERIATWVEVPLTAECEKILRLAFEESQRFGHAHVGTEHLLLGILVSENSLAARVLQGRSLKAAQVREQLAKAKPYARSAAVLKRRPDDSAKLALDNFLNGLKWNTADDLILLFADNAQVIDVFGKRWSREEVHKGFETLFAPYAKKNAAHFVEDTLANEGDWFLATVLWKNAILASLQRVWMHRMSIVLTRVNLDWRIVFLQITAVQPE